MRNIKISRTMYFMGEDLVICIGNEGGSHIGSCVTAVPYELDARTHVTLSTWNRIAHKDGEIAKMYAEAAAKAANRVVCCICGIHLDNITPQEIRAIQSWCQSDIAAMLLALPDPERPDMYSE